MSIQHNHSKYNRRSIRLKGYDYSLPGAYFITICTHNHDCLFGEIANGEMRLNQYGLVVQLSWGNLPNHYSHLELDAFVIMPNHMHGILMLTESENSTGAGFQPAQRKTPAASKCFDRAGLKPAPTQRKRHGLPEIIRGFKTYSGRRINEMHNTSGSSVWQRNYYEHIIRNEKTLNRIRLYIANNPAQWDIDPENPIVFETLSK